MASSHRQWRRLLDKIQERGTQQEDDAMVTISHRLDEISQMAKPRRDQRYVLDRVDPEYRERILKYKDMPREQLRKRKRANWKFKDIFRNAVRLVVLLLKGFRQRNKYYVDTSNEGTLRKKVAQSSDSGTTTSHSRSSLGADFQLCLSTQPHLKDNKDIKRILWILKATKAFKGLFPAEMEKEVAKYVGYEKYDDGRIIACQSRAADRFYFIIAGRVALIRQYKLSSGHVTKLMGHLTKGMTTSAVEMEKQWLREDSLVSHGHVEVFILERKAFEFLQHTTQGPPLDFLRSLDLFEDFPLEQFLKHSDAIEYKYYGDGKSVVKDSNRTPWLLVVKSGQVKVVRRQSVIDSRPSNESKFRTSRMEELGCGRSFSHAEAMLGVQAKQKKTKESLNKPKIYRNKRQLSSVAEHNDDRSVNFEVDNDACAGDSPPSEVTSEPSSTTRERTPNTNGSTPKRKSSKLPQINIGVPPEDDSDKADDFKPHSLWLTREQTEAEKALLSGDADGIFAPKQRPEVIKRRAYLQLDVLHAGDVFGLDHLQPALASEGRGFSLMSEGAEVIMISKRFFLQHAANNTMLKVDTMYKQYISEDDASSALYEQETWSEYKTALWKRMTAPLPAVR